ncbi:MAG: hypothetical protein EOM12_01625 [Verrucomicrobiae bacterium]|nr:hypothetical protein [Verrucomicrobiae bacterium]
MDRRAFLRNISLGAAGLLLPGCVSSQADKSGLVGEELIRDSHFKGGFRLIDPELRVQDYGLWQPFSEEKPVWAIAQWGTREKVVPLNQSSTLSNSCKSISVTRSGSKADLTLAVNGNEEYEGVPRKGDEMWVHLLVEQEIESLPRLVDLKALNFHLEAKLLHSVLHKPELFDDGKHAAQYQAFFYLQDRNKQSEGYGEMIWFGIPVYDNRKRKTERYEALDFAGSGMFICTLAHEDLSADSAHDGKWITLEANLLPEMIKAYSIARAKGFMKKTKSLEDMHLTGMNMGWEVPGLLDVSLQVRRLSLIAEKI